MKWEILWTAKLKELAFNAVQEQNEPYRETNRLSTDMMWKYEKQLVEKFPIILTSRNSEAVLAVAHPNCKCSESLAFLVAF